MMEIHREDLESTLRACRGFRRGVDQLVSAITVAVVPIMQQVRRGFDEFGAAYYHLAERTYLEYHQRLPGSLRTARLRKKRKTKVLAWFQDHLEQHTAK